MKPRTTARLTAKLERKLSAYAIAAGAAGVALTQPADARVIYTPVHKLIERHQYYVLDVDNNGATDFVFRNKSYSSDTNGAYRLFLTPKQAGVVGYDNRSFYWASALEPRVRIGPKKHFVTQKALLASIYFNLDGTWDYGQWFNVKKHYLGLKFSIGRTTHYGWARMNVTVHSNRIVGILTGYAYETTPDKPIIAGDKGPGASLGHLALGAGGMKRREPVKAGK